MSYSVINFQWYFWGYSLGFNKNATSGFIGNLQAIGLRDTLAYPSPGSPLIPDLLYSFYQVSAPSFHGVHSMLTETAAILRRYSRHSSRCRC